MSDIAAVEPVGGGADTFCGGLLYQCYSINEVFCTACGLRSWIVHPLDVNAHLDVVATADADVEME